MKFSSRRFKLGKRGNTRQMIEPRNAAISCGVMRLFSSIR